MKPGDYCNEGKTLHKFIIYICCEKCGRETEVERTYPCGCDRWSSYGWMKRIGCKNCYDIHVKDEWDKDCFSLGMAMYCESGRSDTDHKWYPGGHKKMDIVVKNID